MWEFSPTSSGVIFAAVTILLYLLAWVGARGQSLPERLVTRLGLGLLVVLPIVLAATFGAMREHGRSSTPPVATSPSMRGAPPASPPAGGAPAPSRPESETAGSPPPPQPPMTTRPEATPDGAAPPAGGGTAARPGARKLDETPPAAAPSVPTPEPGATVPPPEPEPDAAKPRGEAPEATPLPQPKAARPAEPSEDSTAASKPPAADPGVKPAPVPAAAQAKWDVVPVYYGTDRKREAEDSRAAYSSERGRRLELGRALVTVPRSHEVPNVERPWVYKLPFTSIVLYREKEDPAHHFTLKEVKSLSREELARLVRERLSASNDFRDHAIVFVHGFNTSFDAALFRTAQIAYDLKFDGAPFVYSWPSKGAFGLQDYSYDRESSGQAQPYFKEFLDFVVNETGAKTVSIVAHSMGNQLLLQVLRDLRHSKPDSVVISQIILAAPDVDRDNFEYLAKEIKGVSKGITMLAASNDRALEISRQFWGGVPRAGDIPAEGPVLVPGIDTIDVTAVSTDMFAINHSGYAEKLALINDMRILIQTGERPPEKRIPILELVETANGSYWRYPSSMR